MKMAPKGKILHQALPCPPRPSALPFQRFHGIQGIDRGNPHRKHDGRTNLPACVSASLSFFCQGERSLDHLLPTRSINCSAVVTSLYIIVILDLALALPQGLGSELPSDLRSPPLDRLPHHLGCLTILDSAFSGSGMPTACLDRYSLVVAISLKDGRQPAALNYCTYMQLNLPSSTCSTRVGGSWPSQQALVNSILICFKATAFIQNTMDPPLLEQLSKLIYEIFKLRANRSQYSIVEFSHI